MLTAAQIKGVVGRKGNMTIINGVVEGLKTHGDEFGILQPHRLVRFLGQIGHEADNFKTVREYHDGSNYEGRRDLGNVRKGDGRRYRGRGVIQNTGRANAREFTKWCRKRGYDCPDFEANPKAMEEFPWAFLVAVWYWSTRKLNRYADRGDDVTLTKRINGGTNGLPHRLSLTTDFSLIFLGYDSVREFQQHAALKADGIAGPVTRKALHRKLKALSGKAAPSGSLRRSRTVAGAGTAVAAGTGVTVEAVIDASQEVQHGLQYVSAGGWISIAIGLVIIAAAGYALYAKWDDEDRPGLSEAFS